MSYMVPVVKEESVRAKSVSMPTRDNVGGRLEEQLKAGDKRKAKKQLDEKK